MEVMTSQKRDNCLQDRDCFASTAGEGYGCVDTIEQLYLPVHSFRQPSQGLSSPARQVFRTLHLGELDSQVLSFQFFSSISIVKEEPTVISRDVGLSFSCQVFKMYLPAGTSSISK